MPSTFSGLKVLVLDDNERCQAIWHRLLTATGAMHVGAGDVDTAQDLLTMHECDLIIADQHLGEADRSGGNFVRWLRVNHDLKLAALPVLACTSDYSELTCAKLHAAGATAVIAKPIVAEEALLAIRSLMSTRSAQHR